MSGLVMTSYLWVALGAVIGAPLRYLVESLANRNRALTDFPIGLFLVNVVGSALAGIVVAGTSGNLRVVLLVGFCGAFTTFSGFGWAATRLWTEARRMFWITVLGMSACCILAFYIAWSITSLLQ
jgi:fluoride exporter